MLINAANKDILHKSEMEYADCLYLKDTGDKVEIDSELRQKMNLVTLKYRPKCAFSGAIVGFRWFTNGQYCLSEQSYIQG